MKKIIWIFVLFFLKSVGAYECGKWKYGSLSFSLSMKIKEGIASDEHTFTIWRSSASMGIWQDNRVLSGGNGEKLTKFFQIKSVNVALILDSLGASGWEAYSMQKSSDGPENAIYEYEFKKCVAI